MSLILNQVMMLKNGKKQRFLRFKTAYQSSLTMTCYVKKVESCLTCFNSFGGQERCYSFAENNFVRATFQNLVPCMTASKKMPKLLEIVA